MVQVAFPRWSGQAVPTNDVPINALPSLRGTARPDPSGKQSHIIGSRHCEK